MREYKILEADTARGLTELVKDHIHKRWEPLGGVSRIQSLYRNHEAIPAYEDTYTQAMVREANDG